jgi:glycyl-tRNA synthetase beta subunit
MKVKLLASKRPSKYKRCNSRGKNMSEQSQGSKYNFEKPEVVLIIEKNEGTVIGKKSSETKQNLAEAAQEIQDLLNQLAQTNPTTTEYEKQALVNKFNEEVKTNSRIRDMILVGGIELIKMLCPPLGIPIEMGKKWLETAEKVKSRN